MALRQEVLAPLGMARTTLSPVPPHARGFAVHPWADVMQPEPAEPAGFAAIAIDLVTITADHEPRLPARWKPLAEVDQALLALTGLWYWGPRPYALRLLPDRGLELAPVTSRGRASRFRAEPDGTWTGLDRYYAGETLRLVRRADGTVGHLDLGSFVFTREPYEPDAPLAARPDPEGWQAFL